jgi:hypothetical protein
MMLGLRLVALFAGLLLIAWSVLLYEPEERHIDDTLARWWVEVDDAAKRTGGRSLRLLQKAAHAVSTWLSEVFGDKLISGRAIAASVVLSLSSLLLFVFTFTIAKFGADTQTLRFAAVMLCLSAVLFYVATTPRLSLSRDLIALTIALYLSRGIYIMYGVLFTNEFPDWSVFDVIVILAGSVGGVTSDFVLIVVTRRITRSIAKVPTFLRGAVAFAANSAVGILFTVGPLFLLMSVPKPPPRWISAIGFAAATNIYGCIISLAVAILLGAIAVQRALWTSLQRPLYAIWRFKLLQNRKLLFYAGSVLVVVGTPRSVDLFKAAETFLR